MFLGYPFIRVTQHAVTWIYGVWIDLSWYRAECLEVGDFPRQLKCWDVFCVFFLHVIYICLLSAKWMTHTQHIMNSMNSTVYLLAKLCFNCDFCGRCRDIRPGRQSSSYPEKSFCLSLEIEVTSRMTGCTAKKGLFDGVKSQYCDSISTNCRFFME